MKKYIINSKCGKLLNEIHWNCIYGVYYYNTGDHLISFSKLIYSLDYICTPDKIDIRSIFYWYLSFCKYNVFFYTKIGNFEEYILPIITPIMIMILKFLHSGRTLQLEVVDEFPLI